MIAAETLEAISVLPKALAGGPAMAVVAALKRFGLVSEANGRISPSHSALEILNLPESDPRRITAIKNAALSPPIYRELVESHKDVGLPGDDVLEAELVTYKGFNPKAVGGFVRDFLDTLNFAGIIVSEALESNDSAVSRLEDSMPSTMNAPGTSGVSQPPPASLATQAAPSSLALANTWIWTLSMPRNVKAELRIAGNATKGDIARLKRQIEFLEESFDEEKPQ